MGLGEFLRGVPLSGLPGRALDLLETALMRIRHVMRPVRPTELILDISGGCNASCPMCPRVYMPDDRRQGFMAFPLFEAALSEARRFGIRDLRLFSTGEPLLHPEFDRMINTARAMGMSIAVSTNGALLESHIEAVLRCDRVQFSIEGWDRNSYEFFRRPLSFEKTVASLQAFDRAWRATSGPKVHRQVNLLLTRETAIQKFIETWGALTDEIVATFMFPPTRFENGRFVRVASGLDERLYPFRQIAGLRRCSYPFSTVTVAYDGKVALCCQDFAARLDLGQIQDGLENVLLAPTRRRIQREFFAQRFRVCAQCPRFFEVPRDEVARAVDEMKRTIASRDPKSIPAIRIFGGPGQDIEVATGGFKDGSFWEGNVVS